MVLSVATMKNVDMRSVSDIAWHCLTAAMPRFMFTGGLSRGKRDLHPTAYLNALRGYAAFAIVNHHKFAYKDTWFFRMPYARLLCSGSVMVCVFFVISGYVLSHPLLLLMRTRDGSKLFERVSSGLFRRYIRLYGSCAAATFISFLLVRLHANPAVHRYDTFLEQFTDWFRETIDFGNPFHDVRGYYMPPGHEVLSHGYLDVLWTIPLELRASIFVYVFCIATARLTYRNRSLAAWSIIAASYWWREFYIIMFLGGLLIADSSIARGTSETSLPSSEIRTSTDTARKSRSRIEGIFFSTVLVFALFVGGYLADTDAEGPWPWNYLFNLIPPHIRGSMEEKHFWPSLGASMTVWALESFPTLQAPLKWDFMQYLGEISFGIYAMHLLVIFNVYDGFLLPLRDAYLGDSIWASAPLTILHWIAVLWAADLFSKIEKQIVLFARWLESKAFTVQFQGSKY
jgi:peptidoglycan/LPS O-acetylase OafA/YrhL